MNEHRIVTRQQWLAEGWTDSELRSRLRDGRLERIAPGTYISQVGFRDEPWETRHRVAVAAAAHRSPELVMSHQSAAVLHGLPVVRGRPAEVHQTRPGRGGSLRSDHRRVHAGILTDTDRTTIDGIAVTTVARTVVDIARTCSEQTSVPIADAALQRRLVAPEVVGAVLHRARSTAGVAAARRALRQVDGRSESPGETLTRLIITRPLLPVPALQAEIRDERGRFVGRVDLALPELGLLLEFDGEVKYRGLVKPGQDAVRVVLDEKRREERLSELGWLVIRVIWSDLRDESRLVERVRSAGAARVRLVAAGSIRGTITVPPAITLANFLGQ
ncbi:MAG: hypothetical protein WKF57_05720 [Nakamurella sp.]